MFTVRYVATFRRNLLPQIFDVLKMGAALRHWRLCIIPGGVRSQTAVALSQSPLCEPQIARTVKETGGRRMPSVS